MEKITIEQVKEFIQLISDVKTLDNISEMIIKKRDEILEQEWIQKTKTLQL